MNKSVVSFIALLMALFVVSCKKEATQTGPSLVKLKTMSATYGYADYPKNENGLLVFRDDKHFDSYLDFLDMAEEKIDHEDENQDVHTVLQEIESAQGFTSLRETTHQQYEKQNEIGWPSPEAIPDEHFITSPEMRSVLNNNLEVQIGGEILHYVNKNISIRVEASNARMLEQYRRLSPTATLDAVRFIDPINNSSSIHFLDWDGSVIIFGKGGSTKPTGTDFVVPPGVRFPNKCTNPKLVEFFGLGLRNAQGYFSGSCVIDYGDNSPLQIKYTTQTIDGIRVPAFQHTYPHPGQYTVKIKGYYAGGGLVETINKTVTVSTGGCTESYKSTDWQYGYMSSTVAWGGKLEMQELNHNSSNQRGRLIAYTKLVRQNSDGSWSGFKGKIFTKLDCYAKSTDGNCNNVDHLVGEGYDNHKKDNLLHRTGQGPFHWQTANSQHTYIDDNGEHSIYIQLNSCP